MSVEVLKDLYDHRRILLIVGANGDGQLTATDGGRVSNTVAVVGSLVGASGEVMVRGTCST